MKIVIKDMLNLSDNYDNYTDIPENTSETYQLFNNIIKQNSLDKDMYETSIDMSEKLSKDIEEANNLLNSFSTISEDTFFSLYKIEPEYYEFNELSETGKINSSIIGDFLRGSETKDLRDICNNNLFNTFVALNNFIPKLKELIEKFYTEDSKKIDLMNNINNLEEYKKALNNIKQNINNPNIINNKVKEIDKKIQSYVKQMNKKENQSFVDKVKNKLKESIPDIKKELNDNKNYLISWGLEESINTNRIPLEQKKYAIERIRKSNKIKKFTDMVGKMRDIAKSEFKRKQTNIKVEIKDVKLGNDIINTVPQELMKLNHPLLKKLFFKNFLENSLLQYEKHYLDDSGKGPIVCNIDESGSMSGEKEIWSKAVVVGLLELAQLQKRDFCLCTFAVNVIKQYEFIRGNVNIKDLFDIVENFANGGGTSFDKCLTWSMDIIKNKTKFRNADIILITDGEYQLNQNFLLNFNNFKKDNDIMCYTILVGNLLSSRSVKLFSDKTYSVNDFINNDITNLFTTVVE